MSYAFKFNKHLEKLVELKCTSACETSLVLRRR